VAHASAVATCHRTAPGLHACDARGPATACRPIAADAIVARDSIAADAIVARDSTTTDSIVACHPAAARDPVFTCHPAARDPTAAARPQRADRARQNPLFRAEHGLERDLVRRC